MRLKTGYKRGLERDESKLLDVIIESNDVYNIHLLNGIYMLNRHKRVRDEDTKKFIELSIKILKEYIVGNDSDLKKYWGIYSIVRKLSYLILDSSYAPLPLNIDLASVLSNFDLLFSRHMESESTFNKAIKQLDEVMQDSIYLAGNSLIATAVRSKEIESKFRQNETKEITIGNQKHTDVFDRVVVIERLLETRQKDSSFLSDIFNEYSSYKYPKVDWDDSNCLVLKFSQAGSYSKLFRKDDYKWEKELHGKCKETYCYVGVFRNPKQEELRIIYSRNRTKKLIHQHQALYTFTAEYVALRDRYISSEFLYRNKYELENLKQIFEFHLKALFGWEYDITFEWLKIEKSDLNSFFTGRGFKKVSDMIDKYIEASDGLVDDDSLHEIKCTRRAVFDSSYRGRFLVFIGVTKVWGKEPKPIAEFDGIILYPNEKEGVIAEIVEAKNKPNGFTEPKNQLNKRLKQRKDIYDYQIERIDNKGAYASISFKVD